LVNNDESDHPIAGEAGRATVKISRPAGRITWWETKFLYYCLTSRESIAALSTSSFWAPTFISEPLGSVRPMTIHRSPVTPAFLLRIS